MKEPVNAVTIPLLAEILPDAVILVFTKNPPAGDIDAVTDPDAIWDRFSPTIALAGILFNSDPSPRNEPENDPVKPPIAPVPGGPVGPCWPRGPVSTSTVCMLVE